MYIYICTKKLFLLILVHYYHNSYLTHETCSTSDNQITFGSTCTQFHTLRISLYILQKPKNFSKETEATDPYIFCSVYSTPIHCWPETVFLTGRNPKMSKSEFSAVFSFLTVQMKTKIHDTSALV